MRTSTDSTIALLVYPTEPDLNFARLVREIDRHIARHCPGGHRLSWDCNDVASFDVGSHRLLLGRSDTPPGGHASCIALAAGPHPDSLALGLAGTCDEPDSRRICARLVEGVLKLCPTQTVLWQQSNAPLDATLIDDLIEALPSRSVLEDATAKVAAAAEEQAARAEREARIRAAVAAKMAEADSQRPAAQPDPASGMAADATAAVNDRPDLPAPDLVALRRVRAALYETPDAPRPTVHARLTAHAFNCTLMAVSLPIGAALFTYSLLRGEDLKLSSRAMAVTGIAVAALKAKGMAAGLLS